MDNIQKRYQRDFVYQYEQKPIVTWSERGDINGKMFSIRKRLFVSMQDNKNDVYDHNLFIYDTKIATFNTHIDSWGNDFSKYTTKGNRSIDHFLHYKTRLILKREFRDDRHPLISEFYDISFRTIFIHREARKKIFLPFIDRRAKYVLSTTEEEWDAIMTQIRLLNL